MPIREEVDAIERFGRRYGVAEPVILALERAVLGTDYGANGYTPMSQAGVLVHALDLQPGRRLLDVGAGCGWPGLYLAARSGCSVVVTDMPLAGMHRAAARIRRDALDSSWAVRATARHLPFRAQGFDAIVHTDVLC